jgi:hypothetical protein
VADADQQHEIDVEVDSLSNSIVHRESETVLATTLVRWGQLTDDQRELVSTWRFDWRQEAAAEQAEVIALLADGSPRLQGLISHGVGDGFVFVRLVESAPHNVGQNKAYKGVPGNLFAYACAVAFDAGYDGFVSFVAKTELIEHYRLTLGAQRLGRSNRMCIDTVAALHLVETYFKERDRWP